MPTEEGITREQSLGELVSRTFELYRRNLTKYLLLFAVIGAITGVLTTLVQQAFVLPVLPANPTTQQVLDWLPGFFGTLIPLIILSVIVTVVFTPVALAATVKMASQEIEKGQADLSASIRFAVSRLVWIWVLSIVVGFIVVVGLLALIVPGILLAIMFSMTFPAFLIEGKGISESMGRSRKLVGQRWLKTLAVIIVFGIIIAIASAIVSAISAPFGWASNIVSSILGSVYTPLIPISLTVYYYSNVARLAPPTTSQASIAPAAAAQAGMKFCPNCGTQLASSAGFCSKCGARQP